MATLKHKQKNKKGVKTMHKELIPTSELNMPKEWRDPKKIYIHSAESCLNAISKNACKFCPNYLTCEYVKKNQANTIINEFSDFTELVIYNRNFYINNDSPINTNVDRARKWFYNENHILIPKSEDSELFKLMQTINDSRKRSVDNIYSYSLCNDWNYFVTLTFKHGKEQKLSDDIVKQQWKIFRQKLQRYYPDIKILLVPEYTPTGVHGMHFHGFIGNCNLDDKLEFARNNKKDLKTITEQYEELLTPNPQYGEILYTKFGDLIYNFKKDFALIGFTTVVKIRENSNKLKLVNYLNKYISKENCKLEYNSKAYFHTHNLNSKNKLVSLLTEEEINNILNQDLLTNIEKVKETSKFKVYRIFKNKN